MTPLHRTLVAAWLVVGGLGASAVVESDGPRSTAVYPPQQIGVRFDHGRHLATGVLWCDDCHVGVAESRSSADTLVPGHPQCAKCHPAATDRPGPRAEAQPEGRAGPQGRGRAAQARESCATCHPGAPSGAGATGVRIPPPNLAFSHARHLDAGAKCEGCHGDLRAVRLATRQQLPRMATCFGCHDDRRASRRCETCHPRAPEGTLRTAYPTGVLVPGRDPLGMPHGAGWDRSHAAAARRDEATCRACHTPQSCLDCHDGVLKPFGVHPADWETAHPVAAVHDALSCRGCHRSQSFCVTCHERLGIGPQAPTGRVLGTAVDDDPTFRLPECDQASPDEACMNLTVHPEGWVTAVDDPERHHSYRARRNIQTCVGCHREEGCLRCHALPALGGIGVGPHPPDFLERCDATVRRNPRACLKCHPVVPEACR